MVVLPVVRGLDLCTTQADAVRIVGPDPGKMVPDVGLGNIWLRTGISVIDSPDLSGVMQPRVSLYYSSVPLVTFFLLEPWVSA